MITSKLSIQPLNAAASKVAPKIEELANRQIVTDLTQTQNPNPAIVQINPGKVASIKPIAPKYTVTIENTTTATQTVYAFNMDTYQSNANGVDSTYSDGFSGKLINKLAADLDGLLIYGFNVTGYDADGVKSDDVVNNLILELRNYNGYGNSFVPTPIDISGSERNTQYKDGLFTVKSQFVINCLAQLKAVLATGCKVQFVFFTQPIQD